VDQDTQIKNTLNVIVFFRTIQPSRKTLITKPAGFYSHHSLPNKSLAS